MRMIGQLRNRFHVPRDQQKRVTFRRKCYGECTWVAPVIRSAVRS
jgi:hypothetical protein